MMYFKGCPKCNGDLYAGEDVHGRYVSCIQCGYLRDETLGESIEMPGEDTNSLAGKMYVIEDPKPAKMRRKKVAQATRPLTQD